MRRRRWRFSTIVFLAFLLCGASGPSVLAQGLGNSQIQGVVKDQTGAVLPDSQVTIRNIRTGAERIVLTDARGRYRVVSLAPGQYDVIVNQQGFATVRRTGIDLAVGQTATVDFTLQVEAGTETVTVTDAAPVVETEDSGFSALLGEEAVENLPINGRRWENFVLLTPTTNPDGNFGLVSYRGVSGLYNNNMVDGADNNQAFFSEARGRTRIAYTISQAAIKEFDVGLTAYSAEFGRAVGGNVNAVTKGGGNEFHGQVFYFIRDDALNAQEPFNKAEGFTQLEERRQQFGFNMGGPVRQDKIFFFLNYDQQIRTFPGVVIDENAFTDSQGNLFGTANFNLSEICDFDAARCDAAYDLLSSRLGPFSRKGLNEVALGKIDWQLNDTHEWGAQYNFHQWRSPSGIQTQDRTNDTPLANGFDGVRTDFFLTRLTSTLSGNKLNEFRFQFGRDFEFQRGGTDGPSVEHRRQLDLDDGQREFLPRVKFPEEYRLQFQDSFTWIKGSHLVKFGTDINWVRDEQINLFLGNGEFEYRTFEAFAMDVPLPGLPVFQDGNRTGRHYRDFNQAFDLVTRGIGEITFSSTDWNFFIQDTWKVRPDFTINLGLRYEYIDYPEPDQSIFSNPTPEFASLPANFQSLARSLNSDTNNFGPRFGFAWDVGARHRLVLRGGYGLYYGRTSNSAVAAGLFENNAITRTSIRLFPNNADAPQFPNTFCDPPLGIDSNSTCIPPADISGSVGLNLFSEDYVQPLVHSWDVAVEFGLRDNLSLELSYIGSRANRLPGFIDVNLPQPSDTVTFFDQSGTQLGVLPFYSGDRPISTFDSIIFSETTVNSWYHGFVVKLKRRFADGLSFDNHLTISKALDGGQSSTTFFAFFSERVDPFDRALEYGRSNFDVRKKWISYFTWDPPFEKIENDGLRKALEGFVFSGIVNLSDGRAFDGDFIFTSGFRFSGAWDAVNPFSTNGSGASGRVPWLARNFSETTGRAVVDLRVQREIRFGETAKLAIIWEAFNLFNRTNFTGFVDDAFIDTNTTCTIVDGACAPGSRSITVAPLSSYQRPFAASNTLFGPREMQIAFKFYW